MSVLCPQSKKTIFNIQFRSKHLGREKLLLKLAQLNIRDTEDERSSLLQIQTHINVGDDSDQVFQLWFLICLQTCEFYFRLEFISLKFPWQRRQLNPVQPHFRSLFYSSCVQSTTVRMLHVYKLRRKVSSDSNMKSHKKQFYCKCKTSGSWFIKSNVQKINKRCSTGFGVSQFNY